MTNNRIKLLLIFFIIILSFFDKLFLYNNDDYAKAIKYWPPVFKNLKGSDLSYADLNHINLRLGLLHKANLLGADLTFSTLWATDLHEANLQETILNHSYMIYVNLIKSNLTNAILQYTSLKSAFLIEAFCENTDFFESNLTDAILRKSNLTNANFSNCILKNVKGLETSIVQGANFKNARGLNQCQKIFLKENGAINVPLICEYDIESEEESNIGKEEAQQYEYSFFKKYFLDPIYRKYQKLFKKREETIQTDLSFQ